MADPRDPNLVQYLGKMRSDLDQLTRNVISRSGAPWTAVTYTNSWVDGVGIQAVQYRRIGDVVQIRGGMRNGTIGATAFTLPVGFRPPSNFDALVLGAAAAAGFFWTVATTGTVTPSGGSNTLSEISGILSFSTTA